MRNADNHATVANLDSDLGTTLEAALQKTSPVSRKFGEAEIKAIALSHLISVGVADRRSLVASEFAIGALRRVDLAIFAGQFIGIEIKSDYDTLKRLDGQLSTYSRVFERLLVVVTQRHVERALAEASPQAEIWKVDDQGVMSLVRPATVPCSPQTDTILSLLTKTELLKLTGSRRDKQTRKALLSLATALPEDCVRAAVIESFRQRFEVSSRRFFRSVASSQITARSIPRLSRFSHRRKAAELQKKQNRNFWSKWTKVAESVFTTARMD